MTISWSRQWLYTHSLATSWMNTQEIGQIIKFLSAILTWSMVASTVMLIYTQLCWDTKYFKQGKHICIIPGGYW